MTPSVRRVRHRCASDACQSARRAIVHLHGGGRFRRPFSWRAEGSLTPCAVYKGSPSGFNGEHVVFPVTD